MKAKLLLLLVLLLGFIAFVIIRFVVLENQNVFGRIKIETTPTTSVFIDNAAVGRTPYEDKIKAGEHILKVIPEGIATDTASWQTKFNVYKNTMTYASSELGKSDVTTSADVFTVVRMEKNPSNPNYGEISIETEPNGAIVSLDNDEKGVASLIMSDVLKGEHELSVFMPGFIRRTKKINVTPGYRLIASVKLAIDQSQAQDMKATDTRPEASPSGSLKKKFVVVKDTPTGFLRVRNEPSVNGSESARVKPGDRLEFMEEKDGWYKIKTDAVDGWISAQYSNKE